MSQKEILDEYDEKNDEYEAFVDKLHDLIAECLVESDINVHSIESRVKDRDSLETKLSEKYDALTDITDITDIAGLRIITHYSDSVDIIAALIEKEFHIDEVNSTDKRKLLDPDRFGYLSLHYVISFKDERTGLTEYKKFKGLKAEVQIRSILQHTWAEIEHDIGYKSNIEMPKPFRRRFSRLAGMLELADDEFIGIREALISYKDDIKKEIITAPEKVTFDAVSLLEFINNNELIREIVNTVSLKYDWPIEEALNDDVSRYLKQLEYHKISTAADLAFLLEKNKLKILKRFDDISLEVLLRKLFKINKGVVIYHLGCIVSAKSGEINEIIRFMSSEGVFGEDYILNDDMFEENLLKFKD